MRVGPKAEPAVPIRLLSFPDMPPISDRFQAFEPGGGALRKATVAEAVNGCTNQPESVDRHMREMDEAAQRAGRRVTRTLDRDVVHVPCSHNGWRSRAQSSAVSKAGFG
jgi:hypothetical protein